MSLLDWIINCVNFCNSQDENTQNSSYDEYLVDFCIRDYESFMNDQPRLNLSEELHEKISEEMQIYSQQKLKYENKTKKLKVDIPVNFELNSLDLEIANIEKTVENEMQNLGNAELLKSGFTAKINYSWAKIKEKSLRFAIDESLAQVLDTEIKNFNKNSQKLSVEIQESLVLCQNKQENLNRLQTLTEKEDVFNIKKLENIQEEIDFLRRNMEIKLEKFEEIEED